MSTGSLVVGPLHHASFPVSDLSRSKQFYGDLLGLEEIERPSFPFEGAWYRAGSCEVHLIVPMEGMDIGRPPTDLNPMAVHTAFAIVSYQSALAHFKESGVEVLETNEDMGQMWVRDPDGNVLELIESR
ncbi:MAG: VOC family protein [Pseudomonadales bacterium]|nr:VOC family protein [Pseudomonadales bacterium]